MYDMHLGVVIAFLVDHKVLVSSLQYIPYKIYAAGKFQVGPVPAIAILVDYHHLLPRV